MECVDTVLETIRLELTSLRIVVWNYIFERLGPIMPREERIEWVKEHRSFLPYFFEIYFYVEDKVRRLLECGLTKKQAVEKVIEVINECQTKMGLKPNLNEMKLLRQLKHRLKLYFTEISCLPFKDAP
ncbi:MAG: hypothetical protein ACTSWF_12065 [Candidatus Freyarchaeota archaeon]